MARKKQRESSEFTSWRGMVDRCTNPRHKNYNLYGGKLCERWRSFRLFLEDMGEKPSTKHTIDRIDGEGIYCKKNCRWSTRREQALNRKVTRWLTFNGETKCLKEWASDVGVSTITLSRRLGKYGMSVEEALTTGPSAARSKFGKTFDEVLHWLQTNFKPKDGRRVELRSKDNLTLDGHPCWGVVTLVKQKNKWVISIDRKAKGEFAIDTLLHEFSHILQNDVEPLPDCHIKAHSSVWGQKYAFLYRKYLRWKMENQKEA